MTNTAELEVIMKDAAEAWRDMQVVRADVGTLEMSGFPAIRLRMQSGRELDVGFGSIEDLSRLGDAITRHAERLADIAAAAERPN